MARVSIKLLIGELALRLGREVTITTMELHELKIGHHIEIQQQNITSPDPIFNVSIATHLYTRLFEKYLGIINSQGYMMREQARIESITASVVKWLVKISATKRNLLIAGPCGTGKTTLIQALYQLLLETKYQHSLSRVSARDIAEIYKDRHDNPQWDAIYRDRPILFLDDLGMEPDIILEWGTPIKPMTMLLHARYERGLTTIITTNLWGQSLIEKYGDSRVLDRLNSYCKMYNELTSFRK